ncbi:MAG: hypothetical protein LBD38_01565 [Streptococcaceae bacterium]|nr:hypothetical protein [Streptococcaceae bacterium]
MKTRFYPDLSRFEVSLFSTVKKRHIQYGIYSLPGCLLIFLERSFFQGDRFLVMGFITALFTIVPFQLKSMGEWERVLKDVRYFFERKERLRSWRGGSEFHEEKREEMEGKRFRKNV